MSPSTPEPSRDDEDPGDDDAVARNRASPARTTPGRAPLGADVTKRLRRITGAVLLIATLVFVAVVILGGLS